MALPTRAHSLGAVITVACQRLKWSGLWAPEPREGPPLPGEVWEGLSEEVAALPSVLKGKFIR